MKCRSTKVSRPVGGRIGLCRHHPRPAAHGAGETYLTHQPPDTTPCLTEAFASYLPPRFARAVDLMILFQMSRMITRSSSSRCARAEGRPDPRAAPCGESTSTGRSAATCRSMPIASRTGRTARSRTSGEYRVGCAIGSILSTNGPSDNPGAIQSTRFYDWSTRRWPRLRRHRLCCSRRGRDTIP